VTVSFALGHDTTATARSQTGCTGVLQTDPGDATHANGYLYGGLTGVVTDRGRERQPR